MTAQEENGLLYDANIIEGSKQDLVVEGKVGKSHFRGQRHVLI